ncbi:hypothetical protein Slin15195_G038930 [Septoria linicola]|uniref:Uncharacterized protein n=1 Tax=Septoria linicola TaxID=215465 RepID=A0A9Q9AM29_9PEZI|nr:hypothetical protein Slin14017_G120340 [Septoria linicola]USW50574.1 hypothetical protein Slin15195_G038930 [Septoria linicola]
MPPKLFGHNRKDTKGYFKIRPESRSSSQEEQEMRRASCETASSARSEKRPADLQRSKTAQSEATTKSGSSRRTGSGSSCWEHHPWAFPFGLRKTKTNEGDILEQSQQQAIDRARKKDEKAARKRNEKEQKAKEKREWPEHFEWFYGANMPEYWVI